MVHLVMSSYLPISSPIWSTSNAHASAHFPVAQACLSAGLNVLCEKPITTNYSEFRVLKQLALENNCMFMENQNFRYHSSIQRIFNLINAGDLGEILDAQICISLNIFGPGSPYVDLNTPHSTSVLRGGVIEDFLPHIAYLAHMCTGPVIDLRTVWTKHRNASPLSADEFRGIIRGERATAYVSFSGNSQPDGFWVRMAERRPVRRPTCMSHTSLLPCADFGRENPL